MEEQMRKSVYIFAAALMTVASCPFALSLTAQAARHEIWLGDYVARIEETDCVWQSALQVGQGFSRVRYGYESVDGQENKFLRLANFDGTYDTQATGVTVRLATASSQAQTVSFRYRFYEGDYIYTDDMTVLTLSLDGVEYQLTTDDVTPCPQDGYGWATFSKEITSTASHDRMTLVFSFEKSVRYSNSQTYLDVDDLSVTSSEGERVSAGDFEYASADNSGDKATDFDTEVNHLESKQQYMLDTDGIAQYSVNTAYSQTESANFNGGTRTVALPRRASTGTSQGTASGESDTYAVYDGSSDNTYLRLGNFNGTTTTQTRFTMYFHDPVTGEIKKNMPAVNQIYISFRYRLYLDDTSRALIDRNDAVITISTRSSSTLKSGNVYLDELTVNEVGDDTWHEFNMILETRLGTTANVSVYFYGQSEASYTTGTYIDLDDYVMATPSGDNYSHLRGTFEGLVPESVTDDPLNGCVYFNPTLGVAGTKTARNSVDYALALEKDETVSIKTDFAPATNVYHITFEVLGNGSLDLYLSGRSGDKFTLTVGTDVTTNAIHAKWTETEGSYVCSLYVARLAQTVMRSVDFVNRSSAPIMIDNVFVGQVESVDCASGDYATYLSSLGALKERVQSTLLDYLPTAQRQIRLALANAEQITEYASQPRMDAALHALTSSLAEENMKTDLSVLNEVLERADLVFAESNQRDYTRASWVVFTQGLQNARKITGENTQEEVLAAAEALSAAIEGLEPAQLEEDFWLAIGIGGLSGVGGVVAIGAIVFTKKKRRGNDNA